MSFDPRTRTRQVYIHIRTMLQGLAIFVSLIAATLCLLHYLVRCGRRAELIDKIPGPPAWPIVGNLMLLMTPTGEKRKCNFIVMNVSLEIKKVRTRRIPLANHLKIINQKTSLLDFLHFVLRWPIWLIIP